MQLSYAYYIIRKSDQKIIEVTDNMVDAFRGIKLKDYNMETVTDLEELNGEINGSK